MEEITIKLEPVERTEAWLLWEIEDRVAQRVSPVFCSPPNCGATGIPESFGRKKCPSW